MSKDKKNAIQDEIDGGSSGRRKISEAEKRNIEEHFKKKGVRSLNSFVPTREKNSGTKGDGLTKGNFVADLDAPAEEKYLAKVASHDPKDKEEKNDKQDLVVEYIFGPLFQRFLYDRAPQISLVVGEEDIEKFRTNLNNAKKASIWKQEDGKWVKDEGAASAGGPSTTKPLSDKIYITSELYDSTNFSTFHDFQTAHRSLLPKIEGFEKVIAACIFLGDIDYHKWNTGVNRTKIGQDPESGEAIYKYEAVKIDQGRAGSYTGTGLYGVGTSADSIISNMIENFRERGYATNMLDPKKLNDSIKEMLQITDDEINYIVARRKAELKQAGVEDPKLEQNFAVDIINQRKAMMELSERLDIIEKITPPIGSWLKEIGVQNPIIWSVKNGKKIEGKNPLKWSLDEDRQFAEKAVKFAIDKDPITIKSAMLFAVENGILIAKKDPIEYAIDNHKAEAVSAAYEYTTKHPEYRAQAEKHLKYAIEKFKEVDGIDPIAWAAQNGKTIDGIDPIAWAIINKIEVIEYQNHDGYNIYCPALKWAVENDKIIDGKQSVVWAYDHNPELGDRALKWSVISQQKIDGIDPIAWSSANSKTIDGIDPITWAAQNSHSIDSKDPIIWAVENGKTIDGIDPIAWAVRENTRIDDKSTIIWAVENGKTIDSIDTIAWAVRNNARMQLAGYKLDPIEWAIRDDKTIEGKNPVIWAIENWQNIDGASPGQYCAENKIDLLSYIAHEYGKDPKLDKLLDAEYKAFMMKIDPKGKTIDIEEILSQKDPKTISEQLDRSVLPILTNSIIAQSCSLETMNKIATIVKELEQKPVPSTLGYLGASATNLATKAIWGRTPEQDRLQKALQEIQTLTAPSSYSFSTRNRKKLEKPSLLEEYRMKISRS